MTLGALYAKAVAFDASGANRHLRNLSHSEREVVLGMVANMRAKRRRGASRRLTEAPPRPALWAAPSDRNRLRRQFWLDQRGIPS